MAAFLVAVIPFPRERRGSTAVRYRQSPGYNYTGPIGNASAADLQATIWWLEGEGNDPKNQFSNLSRLNSGAPRRPWLDNNG